jgi:hypothetical protein
MIHTLQPDAQGYLIIRGTYKPGDIIQLKGKFKAVAVYDLFGEAGKPIFITNAPNETLTIDQITWSGGAWPHGLAVRNSKHLVVFGTTKSQFKIIGSNSPAVDSNGNTVRGAYMNFIIGELSDNITAHDISITYGGTGIVAKTDVSKTDSKTWFPNTYLENFEFFNIEISNTVNEGMYIGHTATWWDINKTAPLYTTPPPNSGSYIRQPIKLRNVKIHHNYIHNVGVDGIQTAAIDNLKISDNIIEDWATKKEGGHNGGILVGGRVVDFEVANNFIHDGWGEFLQIYADAGKAVVKNNLFVKNSLSGIGLRGGKGLAVEFYNNTIVQPGESAFRINGSTGGVGNNIIKKNIIAGLSAGRVLAYTENGGKTTATDNLVYPTLADAKLNDKFISSVAGYGYSPATPQQPEDPQEPIIKMSVSVTLPTLKLPEGAHDLKVIMPDGTASNIKVIVEREK